MLDFVVPSQKNGYKAYLIKIPALVVFFVLLTFFNLIAKSSIQAQDYSSTINIENLLSEHNKIRVKNGLPSLKLNPLLIKSAQTKAEEMLNTNCWSHYCPPGVEPWTFFDQAGYVYIYAGENLAEGFSNIEEVMNAWMNSKTHRENIVKKDFQEVGFGLINGNYQGKSNNTIVVVHFGTQVNLTAEELTSPSIKILNPKENETINQDFINVDGEVNQIESIEIYNNNVYKGSPSILDGIFTYRIEDPSEGKNIVTVTGQTTSDQIVSSTVEVLVNLDTPKTSGVSVISQSGLPFSISSNAQNIINITFIIFFAVLFLIDFLVLTRTNVLNLRKSFSHYHFAIILISGVLLLIGGFAGNIA